MIRDRKWVYSLAVFSVLIAVFHPMYSRIVLDLPFGYDMLIGTIISILMPWCILPLVRFRKYTKVAGNDTDLGRAKTVLVALSIGLSLLFAWNLADEMYLQPPPSFIAVLAILWLTVPFINVLVGIRTAKRKVLRMTLVIAAYYFLWMLLYVANGSTQGKMGAEHMHLLFAPFVMVMCSPVVLYGEFCLRRFETWLSLRKLH